MTDEPDEVGRRNPPPPRSAPRFVCFKGVDGGDSTYFIYIEQNLLCQLRTFNMALVVWFASHYVFNLEYVKSLKEVAMFIQEFVFCLPDNIKKSATYLTVCSDIQSFCS